MLTEQKHHKIVALEFELHKSHNLEGFDFGVSTTVLNEWLASQLWRHYFCMSS